MIIFHYVLPFHLKQKTLLRNYAHVTLYSGFTLQFSRWLCPMLQTFTQSIHRSLLRKHKKAENMGNLCVLCSYFPKCILFTMHIYVLSIILLDKYLASLCHFAKCRKLPVSSSH
uniref:Uncharacterized protein n=1 Tax=Pyxicephalus adspersus TaxID=30357 RepID=A0AAV3B671_PYXAD|nr:TPA: hypothetical protein GDO54_001420 [Pyxicephalus adspersus]